MLSMATELFLEWMSACERRITFSTVALGRPASVFIIYPGTWGSYSLEVGGGIRRDPHKGNLQVEKGLVDYQPEV